MEFKNTVFNAARDGKLYRLKVFLRCLPRDVVQALVCSLTNGATPLVIACRNGHISVADYLINTCHADIEQCGSVTFHGGARASVSPLYCAVVMGNFSLVKLLVSYKASINSRTKTSSTPLRVACFNGHFKIVKYLIQHGAGIEIANRKGHTCLMIACDRGHFKIAEYLIKKGADLNRKYFQGNTALHDCAESGHLEILKLLLEHGAQFEGDSCGITPLLSAAISGKVAVVEYFINEFDCTKLEKVNALEILGATFMDKKKDGTMALEFWKRAMKLRYEDAGNLLLKPSTQSLMASYVNASEVQTVSQLEELRYDNDEMITQSLLVRERILGPNHEDTIVCIKLKGLTYAKNGHFDRCIQLWLYAFDMQQKVQEPLSSGIQSSLRDFANVFSHVMSEEWALAGGFQFISFPNILGVFERVVKEIERAMKLSEKQGKDLNVTHQFNHTLIFVINLIGIMCCLKPLHNKSEELELKKSVYKLVRINPKARNNGTLLHLACSEIPRHFFHHQIMSFPSSEVVDLLLEVGACPNAVDVDNNTPLHISAMNKEFAPAVFKSFLKHGAHLDSCNCEKQTPLQLARDIPLSGIYPLQHINLQCLCAQVIQTNNISYREFVPKELEVFLDVH